MVSGLPIIRILIGYTCQPLKSKTPGFYSRRLALVGLSPGAALRSRIKEDPDLIFKFLVKIAVLILGRLNLPHQLPDFRLRWWSQKNG